MKISKLSAIIVAIAATFGVSSVVAAPQRFSDEARTEIKPSKAAKKQAKQTEKEGWKVPIGSLPMDQQIQKAMWFENANDNDGSKKYYIGRAHTEAQYQDVARAQAMEQAKLDIAGQIEQSLVSEVEQTLGKDAAEESVAISNMVKTSKSLVNQTISNIITVTEVSMKNTKGLYEVQVAIAADRANVTSSAKRAIYNDLKKRGYENLKKLDEKGWNK